MYLAHFGLNEAPFRITPHTEFFFSGAHRGATLEALIYAITNGEGIVKVTGEVGAGKTMLCRVLMERLPKSVETIYVAVPSLSRDEILTVIAEELGLNSQNTTATRLIRHLQEHLIKVHAEGRQVVALIDEAHAMPLETLEEIRLLSNLETSHHKLLQIVLFGQPELDAHLSLPNMRQLRERITHSFSLAPLPTSDIRDYIDFRMRAAGYRGPELFTADVLKHIASASEGLTRRINIFADKTLLAAFAEGTHTITPAHVRAAVQDTQVVASPPRRPRYWLWGGLMAGFTLAALIGFLAGRVTITADRPADSLSSPEAKRTNPSTPDAADSTHARVASTQSSTPQEQTARPASKEAPLESGEAGASSRESPSLTISSLEQRMAADVKRLRDLPPPHYTIQLMTADAGDLKPIAVYLRAAGRELNPERLMVIPVGTKDIPRISVLYGNYADRAGATGELSGLPASMTRFKPYARSVQALLNEIRQ